MIKFLKTYWKSFLIGFFLILAYMGISFGITLGIIKLICWCFGKTFSFKVATGVWIIYIVIVNLVKGLMKHE